MSCEERVIDTGVSFMLALFGDLMFLRRLWELIGASVLGEYNENAIDMRL